MSTEDHSRDPAPADDDRNPATHPDQASGQDHGLADRLDRDPSCENAKLDVELDQSMDASDPPSQTQPGSSDRATVPDKDADEHSAHRK